MTILFGLLILTTPLNSWSTGQVERLSISIFQALKLLDKLSQIAGVFVFQDSLALDYRMGAEWNSAKVEAFLKLPPNSTHQP